jgi:hypothetical protein
MVFDKAHNIYANCMDYFPRTIKSVRALAKKHPKKLNKISVTRKIQDSGYARMSRKLSDTIVTELIVIDVKVSGTATTILAINA